MSGPVRIGFVGNVANTLFRIASALRDDPSVEPHLFVNHSDAAIARPESADQSLAAGYPDWIHEGRWITPASVIAPWRSPLARALRDMHLVVASGPGPIFAQHAGRPWCWYVTGGDLTVKPFPREFWRWYDSWPHRVGELIGGTWQRRAARRADRLWLQPFAPMTGAADRLGIAPDRRSDRYLPLPVDTDRFTPDGPDSGAVGGAEARDRMATADLVIWHPSRLVMDATPALVRTGQWKGNDALIRALPDLVGRIGDPVLVLPEFSVSRDVEAARALIDDLGVGDHVAWVRSRRPEGFDHHEMAELYRAADVVCDEFGVGWFGYVALEGLASGRPVVSHVDVEVMARLYPDGHPIVAAQTPAQIAAEIAALHDDPARRARVGAEGRAWILREHSADAVRARYRDAIAELVTDLAR